MLIINFSHSLTPAQLVQIEAHAKQLVTQVTEIPVQFDDQQDFEPQLQKLLAQLDLRPVARQGQGILLVLPALNWIAAMLVAEWHGRMGHFPSIVRLRPVPDQTPRVYEVAEIVDLQQLRDQAREER